MNSTQFFIYCNECDTYFETEGANARHVCKSGKKIAFTGWTCPVCGRGNSPYVETCPCWQTNNTTVATGANFYHSLSED